MIRTYVVDIDGTLADLTHRLRHIQQEPKDWDAFFDACGGDLPIVNVVDVIDALARAQVQYTEFIYLTGRPERVREETLWWLGTHGLPAGRLVMRADGDHRPDTLAKRELMEELVKTHAVVGVFEDRPSVCRTWREMGLTVFQMTDKEF